MAGKGEQRLLTKVKHKIVSFEIVKKTQMGSCGCPFFFGGNLKKAA
jgi:hypothetical protein